MSISYVRWMGIGAWTCGPSIPRHSRGVAMTPGDTPGHVAIETASGCALPLAAMEREHTHIQWLLGGGPRDDEALAYEYQQRLRVTRGSLEERAFAVVDFGGDSSSGHDRAYGPEASLAAACRVSDDLAAHVPQWPLAEPLGLFALAVREYLAGATLRRLTREYVHCQGTGSPGPGSYLAYARLAYSMPSHHQPVGAADAPDPPLTLHLCAADPIFTPEVVAHLINRAQRFADAFGSAIDCRAVFHQIVVHGDFPATVHEPDAAETPVILFRIPLATDLFPTSLFPASLFPTSLFPATPTTSPAGSARQATPAAPASTGECVVLRRDPDSGTIRVRPFTPGRSMIDRSIRRGGYLFPAEVIAGLQRESSAAKPGCLAALATPRTLWESLATWGVESPAAWGRGSSAAPGDTSVRAVHPGIAKPRGASVNGPLLRVNVDAAAPRAGVLHDVCDVLDALGVDPRLDYPIEIAWTPSGPSTPDHACTSGAAPGCGEHPCLWPRALGERQRAASDLAVALAVVRRALRGHIRTGVEWIGVRHAPPAAARAPHLLRVAVACDGAHVEFSALAAELSGALVDACAAALPGAFITCEIVSASELADAHHWVTAAGYHPRDGFLPSFMQLERLVDG